MGELKQIKPVVRKEYLRIVKQAMLHKAKKTKPEPDKNKK